MGVLKSNTTGVHRAKVVLLGEPGVGKTSLVQRFVHSVFSEKHKSTLGVKVDRKTVVLDGTSVALLIWDMHGETEGLSIPANYLTGTGAGIVVFDSTRPETVDLALNLGERLVAASPEAQIQYVANKSDLEFDQAALSAKLTDQQVTATSAKTGDGVEELFDAVARSVL